MPTFDILAKYATSAETIDHDIVSIKETITRAGWTRTPGGGQLFDSNGRPVAQIVIKDGSGAVVGIEQNFRLSKSNGTEEEAREVVQTAVRTTTRLGRLVNITVKAVDAVKGQLPAIKREYRIVQVLVGGALVLGILVYLKGLLGTAKGFSPFSGIGGVAEAEAYVRKIRNSGKRRFAEDLLAHYARGAPAPEWDRAKYGISPMTFQAVNMQLKELLR